MYSLNESRRNRKICPTSHRFSPPRSGTASICFNAPVRNVLIPRHQQHYTVIAAACAIALKPVRRFQPKCPGVPGNFVQSNLHLFPTCKINLIGSRKRHETRVIYLRP